MANAIGTTPGTGRQARVTSLGAGGEFAQYVGAVTGRYQVLGYDILTVGATVIVLGTSPSTIPGGGVTHALISVKATSTATDTDGVPDGINIRQDNVAPTITDGIFLQGGVVMEACPITVAAGEDTVALSRIKMVAAQAQSMKVTVEYRSYAAA